MLSRSFVKVALRHPASSKVVVLNRPVGTLSTLFNSLKSDSSKAVAASVSKLNTSGMPASLTMVRAMGGAAHGTAAHDAHHGEHHDNHGHHGPDYTTDQSLQRLFNEEPRKEGEPRKIRFRSWEVGAAIISAVSVFFCFYVYDYVEPVKVEAEKVRFILPDGSEKVLWVPTKVHNPLADAPFGYHTVYAPPSNLSEVQKLRLQRLANHDIISLARAIVPNPNPKEAAKESKFPTSVRPVAASE